VVESSPRISPVSTSDPGVATKASSESPANVASKGSRWDLLHVHLSRFQAFVGLLAGLVSIAGAAVSVMQFFKPTPGTGEVLMVIQGARSGKAVSDATIEILTSQNALVTTMRPDALGRARHALKEGTYRVRVSHPGFGAEVRQIQVFSRQTVELTVRLRPGSSSPLERAGRTVNQGVRAVRHLFGF